MRTQNKKITKAIKSLLYNPFAQDNMNLPFYGEFALSLTFEKTAAINTCAVGIKNNTMYFFYNEDFVEKLSDRQMVFVLIHEVFHLLLDHIPRNKIMGYDNNLSNIAQDIVINNTILANFSTICDIPKTEKSENMGVFHPNFYDGLLNYDSVYNWLLERMDYLKQNNITDPKGYGDFSIVKNELCGYKTPLNSTHIDDFLLQDDKTIKGCRFDEHILGDISNQIAKELNLDEIPLESIRSVVDEVVNKLKTAGIYTSDNDYVLGQLRSRKEDYIKKLKKSLSNLVKGKDKFKTYTKLNRRGINGIKGKTKKTFVKNINVLLDTSGSMWGSFENILGYLHNKDITINLFQVDTELNKKVEELDSKKIDKIEIKGGGGTSLQPGLDLISEEYNKYPTVIITDGYLNETLDFTGINKSVLVLYTDIKINHKNTDRIRQIKIETE